MIPVAGLPVAGLPEGKIRSWHRDRLGVVYVRQSTRQQVLDHSESTRLQYGLVERAVAVGAAGLHFHDLRHTGNTLAAESGASLRDLMAWMGHDSMQAAVIYQHRVTGADRRIADAMNDLIRRKDDGDTDDDGPQDDSEDDPDDGVPRR